MNDELNHIVADTFDYQTTRLAINDRKQIARFRIGNEVIYNLKRIYSLC